MPFFVRKKKSTKKQSILSNFKAAQQNVLNNKKRKAENEEISSDSDLDTSEFVIDDVEKEAEKKLRLAKDYIVKLQKDVKLNHEENDSNEIADEFSMINKQLKEDRLMEAGTLQRRLADKYTICNKTILKNGHRLSVTCVEMSYDCKFVYSGSKDGIVIKWVLSDESKKACSINFRPSVYCMSLTTDGIYLAIGGFKHDIELRKASDLSLHHVFSGHRSSILGLKFRAKTSQLLSCSSDKLIKIWNIDEMAYVETLFGHEAGITSIDSLVKERAITSGGFDKSIRIWKIVEESQLVFNLSNCSSIECVAFINEDYFISGSDNNCLHLWSILKKKPIFVLKNAHKNDDSLISSVAALSFSDLVVSGSNDGEIKFWKCADNFKSLNLLFVINFDGFINSLKFRTETKLVVAIGQEHKLGRWWKNKSAKNCVVIFNLSNKE